MYYSRNNSLLGCLVVCFNHGRCCILADLAYVVLPININKLKTIPIFNLRPIFRSNKLVTQKNLKSRLGNFGGV